MALNLSAQSAAMGAATFAGGLIISRDAQELVPYFWVNAMLGAVAATLGLRLLDRLKPKRVVKPGRLRQSKEISGFSRADGGNSLLRILLA